MHINKETLTGLMRKNQMSQTGLATASTLSAKTIGRVLKEDRNQTENTVQALAKALQVEPAVLGNPPDRASEIAALEQRAMTYRHYVTLRGTERLSFDLVQRHYNVSNDYIIKAAPLMFSLVAELCLKKRREDLDRACEWDNSIPPHLRNASGLALSQMDEVLRAERESIARADLFGCHLLDSLDFYADPYAPVPFRNFLVKFSEDLNYDAFPEVDVDRSGIDYKIFAADLDAITNGDSAAKLALEHGRVRIRDIPEGLFQDGKATERADWLKRHLTDDDLEWLDVVASFSLEPNATEGTE